MELDLRSLTATSVLGRGAKGVVFAIQTQPQAQSQALALKAISRKNIDKNAKGDDAYRRIWTERDVLRSLRHPLLPSLRGQLLTESVVGYAIELCTGGDLASLRRKQSEHMFSDDAIRFYAAELVVALEYLHRLGIAYRDLKPENILIQQSGHIMLVDFDLSVQLSQLSSSRSQSSPVIVKSEKNPKRSKKSRRRRFFSYCFSDRAADVSPEITAPDTSTSNQNKSNSFVGTEDYVAPEIISGSGHDFAVDWWSLGVVLYEMLYGKTPFRGANRKETFYRVLARSPELTGERTALRDLIGRLLEKEPAKRIGAEEIKGHEFFRGAVWEEVLEISRPPFIPPGADWEESGGEEIDVEKFVEGIFGGGAMEEGVDENSKKDSFGVF